MNKFFLFLLPVSLAFSQTSVETKPKLVVGIVVDQMRQEYLYRFSPKFGNGGFKRLMNEGFMVRNAHYNYVPTVTGPGHASIYTGTTPAMHGIIGNDWYDKGLKKNVNCVSDDNQKVVGVEKIGGGISPWRLLSSTVTDELKVFTQKKAKVIGISFKDRGAVLPAGHAADGAYWYDGASGKFVSSTFYKPGLPLWLEQFNALQLPDKYLAQTWNTLLPIDQYKESGPDDTPYEVKFKGKERPVFPYVLSELRKANDNFSLLANTPFGDDVLTELAKAALVGENMGTDEIPDFLAISYSVTDAVGHDFGPNSIEVEDVYLRLDKNIEDLLQTLDKKVGQGQYVIFLSADHGVAEVPRHMIDMKIPAGLFDMNKLEKGLTDHLNQYYPGVKLIEKISNYQIFLDHTMFRGDPKVAGVDLLITSQLIAQYLASVEGVNEVYQKNNLKEVPLHERSARAMVARGLHPRRSGDIAFTLLPGWTSSAATGASHSSVYSYDTHIPMIFFGMGINKGVSDQYHPITDIAPTISTLLKIKFPNSCEGQPVTEAIKN